MTTKERLIQELEQAPEELIEAVLNFVLTAKENSNQTQTVHRATKTGKSIWQIAEDFVKDLPETELAKLPSDGAEQHDHYIYGTPKIGS